MKKNAVYAGTFDPVTNFDLSILERCVPLFDRITLLMVNNDRNTFFLPGERLLFLNRAAETFANVTVDHCAGLVGTYCKDHNIPIMIRAIQDMKEMEKETLLAQRDKRLFPELETFFMIGEPDHLYGSSELVKELAMLGSDVESLLPESSAEMILDSFQEHLAIDRALGEIL